MYEPKIPVDSVYEKQWVYNEVGVEPKKKLSDNPRIQPIILTSSKTGQTSLRTQRFMEYDTCLIKMPCDSEGKEDNDYISHCQNLPYWPADGTSMSLCHEHTEINVQGTLNFIMHLWQIEHVHPCEDKFSTSDSMGSEMPLLSNPRKLLIFWCHYLWSAPVETFFGAKP